MTNLPSRRRVIPYFSERAGGAIAVGATPAI
jgi:hypothetical protein